jgi:hypothetical protein
MKKIIRLSELFLSAMAIAFYISACDKVDEPYKKQAVIPIDTTGVLTGNTISDTINKTVLLEDYTGHT